MVASDIQISLMSLKLPLPFDIIAFPSFDFFRVSLELPFPFLIFAFPLDVGPCDAVFFPLCFKLLQMYIWVFAIIAF